MSTHIFYSIQLSVLWKAPKRWKIRRNITSRNMTCSLGYLLHCHHPPMIKNFDFDVTYNGVLTLCFYFDVTKKGKNGNVTESVAWWTWNADWNANAGKTEMQTQMKMLMKTEWKIKMKIKIKKNAKGNVNDDRKKQMQIKIKVAEPPWIPYRRFLYWICSNTERRFKAIAIPIFIRTAFSAKT